MSKIGKDRQQKAEPVRILKIILLGAALVAADISTNAVQARNSDWPSSA